MPVLRLDRLKPFSECKGERQPDDPHYRVAFSQGQKVGKDIVLLPFDSSEELVHDDGKVAPYFGVVEGKQVQHQPLYTQQMRTLVATKMKRLESTAARSDDDDDDDAAGTEGRSDSMLEDVNFASWLRGEVRYEWPLLQVAAKSRFSRIFTSKREMVADLVLDQKVIPEDQVSPELAKLLPEQQTA